MTDVKVRGAAVEVRSLKVTKALLKQVRKFKGDVPEPFRAPRDSNEDHTTKINPEFAVGWFRGVVLNNEHEDYVLFLKENDLYLWSFYRSLIGGSLQLNCKQLYIA